jgi:ribosomal protein S27AE
MADPRSGVHADALNCPACGAPVTLAHRFVKMVVCGHCGSTLAVQNDRLDPTGKSAALADLPTRFRVGQEGAVRGRPFRVLGRVRFTTDDGPWDEWYLAFADGEIAWLEEEEGGYTLARPQPLRSPVPPFDQVRVGNSFPVNDQSFFVTERCRAQVAGAEGQLFFRARPGQPVQFVDGNLGGRTAAIEYGEDAIEYTVGEPLRRDEVTLVGE